MGTARRFLRGIGPLQINITRFYVIPAASVQKQITPSRLKSDGVVALDGNESFFVDRVSVSSSEGPKLISFTDFENAFKVKTTSEIVRALAVYKICSFDFLVERNKEVVKLLTVAFWCSAFACTVHHITATLFGSLFSFSSHNIILKFSCDIRFWLFFEATGSTSN